MKKLILWAFLVIPVLASAQIKATTENGKAVVLFEDGTWDYVSEETVQGMTAEAVEIDRSLTKESELTELYNAESKRLVKFFGPIKGKIRGRAKCMILEGKPKVFFQWEFGLLDSYRYFGQMKPGKILTIKTKSNASIELVLNEDIEMEYMEKYNYSIMKGACMLNDEQFKMLMNNPVAEIEVHWKKTSESYTMNDAYFFSKSFAELLE